LGKSQRRKKKSSIFATTDHPVLLSEKAEAKTQGKLMVRGRKKRYSDWEAIRPFRKKRPKNQRRDLDSRGKFRSELADTNDLTQKEAGKVRVRGRVSREKEGGGKARVVDETGIREHFTL